jgi:hypothetical protein
MLNKNGSVRVQRTKIMTRADSKVESDVLYYEWISGTALARVV